jgi:hypothetical protein
VAVSTPKLTESVVTRVRVIKTSGPMHAEGWDGPRVVWDAFVITEAF